MNTHPPYMGYHGIRSTSGRYASYYNAFLFLQKHFTVATVLHEGHQYGMLRDAESQERYLRHDSAVSPGS